MASTNRVKVAVDFDDPLGAVMGSNTTTASAGGGGTSKPVAAPVLAATPTAASIANRIATAQATAATATTINGQSHTVSGSSSGGAGPVGHPKYGYKRPTLKSSAAATTVASVTANDAPTVSPTKSVPAPAPAPAPVIATPPKATHFFQPASSLVAQQRLHPSHPLAPVVESSPAAPSTPNTASSLLSSSASSASSSLAVPVPRKRSASTGAALSNFDLLVAPPQSLVAQPPELTPDNTPPSPSPIAAITIQQLPIPAVVDDVPLPASSVAVQPASTPTDSALPAPAPAAASVTATPTLTPATAAAIAATTNHTPASPTSSDGSGSGSGAFKLTGAGAPASSALLAGLLQPPTPPAHRRVSSLPPVFANPSASSSSNSSGADNTTATTTAASSSVTPAAAPPPTASTPTATAPAAPSASSLHTSFTPIAASMTPLGSIGEFAALAVQATDASGGRRLSSGSTLPTPISGGGSTPGRGSISVGPSSASSSSASSRFGTPTGTLRRSSTLSGPLTSTVAGNAPSGIVRDVGFQLLPLFYIDAGTVTGLIAGATGTAAAHSLYVGSSVGTIHKYRIEYTGVAGSDDAEVSAAAAAGADPSLSAATPPLNKVICRVDLELVVDVRSYHLPPPVSPASAGVRKSTLTKPLAPAPLTNLQLCVEPLQYLFALCDGVVACYRMSDLTHVYTLPPPIEGGSIMKGGSSAATKSSGKASTSAVDVFDVRVRQGLVFLAVARGKRLYIRQRVALRSTGQRQTISGPSGSASPTAAAAAAAAAASPEPQEWPVLQEVILPDSARTLAWLTDSMIGIGFQPSARRAMHFLDVQTGRVIDLGAIALSLAPVLSAEPIIKRMKWGPNIAAATPSNSASTAVAISSQSAAATPAAVLHTYIISHGDRGVIIRLNPDTPALTVSAKSANLLGLTAGGPGAGGTTISSAGAVAAPPSEVKFNAKTAPLSMASAGAYLMCLYGNEIQIQRPNLLSDLSTYTAHQTVPLAGGSMLCDSGESVVFVARSSQVYFLQPIAQSEKIADDHWYARLQKAIETKMPLYPPPSPLAAVATTATAQPNGAAAAAVVPVMPLTISEIVRSHIASILNCARHPFGQMILAFNHWISAKYQRPLNAAAAIAAASAGSVTPVVVPATSAVAVIDSSSGSGGSGEKEREKPIDFDALIQDTKPLIQTFVQRMAATLQSHWRALQDKELTLIWTECVEEVLYRTLYPTLLGLCKAMNQSDDAAFAIARRDMGWPIMDPSDFGSQILDGIDDVAASASEAAAAATATATATAAATQPKAKKLDARRGALTVFERAVELLKSMTALTHPTAKLKVLSQVHRSVCDGASGLWMTTHKKAFTMSADDLIPILCYVLIRSDIPTPFAELHFIAEYMPSDDALGHAGYMLTSMQIVTQHINKVASDQRATTAAAAIAAGVGAGPVIVPATSAAVPSASGGSTGAAAVVTVPVPVSIAKFRRSIWNAAALFGESDDASDAALPSSSRTIMTLLDIKEDP